MRHASDVEIDVVLGAALGRRTGENVETGANVLVRVEPNGGVGADRDTGGRLNREHVAVAGGPAVDLVSRDRCDAVDTIRRCPVS